MPTPNERTALLADMADLTARLRHRVYDPTIELAVRENLHAHLESLLKAAVFGFVQTGPPATDALLVLSDGEFCSELQGCRIHFIPRGQNATPEMLQFGTLLL